MSELAEVLLERDFVLLQHYAQKRMLPAVRNEYMLAQVAMMVVQAAGHLTEGATLTDFLLRLREPDDAGAADGDGMTAEVGAAIVAGISGAKVIYLKKKDPAAGQHEGANA